MYEVAGNHECSSSVIREAVLKDQDSGKMLITQTPENLSSFQFYLRSMNSMYSVFFIKTNYPHWKPVLLLLHWHRLKLHLYNAIPANTKYLYNICTKLNQRRRRRVDVVQVFYKCFVFAGMSVHGKQRWMLAFQLGPTAIYFNTISFPLSGNTIMV